MNGLQYEIEFHASSAFHSVYAIQFFLQKSSPIKLNDVDPTPFSDLTEEFRDIRYTSVGTSGVVDIGTYVRNNI